MLKAKNVFKGLQGVDNVYTQHAPLLVETLQQLVKNDLSPAAYPYMAGAQVSAHVRQSICISMARIVISCLKGQKDDHMHGRICLSRCTYWLLNYRQRLCSYNAVGALAIQNSLFISLSLLRSF